MCFFSIVKVVMFDRVIGPQNYCADKKTVGPLSYCGNKTRKLIFERWRNVTESVLQMIVQISKQKGCFLGEEKK